jgi:hypothetical protein
MELGMDTCYLGFPFNFNQQCMRMFFFSTFKNKLHAREG